MAECMPSQYITKCTCRGTLPHTTGIAAFPQQRWSRCGFQGAYQTTDPNWDGPKKQSKPPVTSKPVVIHVVHIKVRLCELKVALNAQFDALALVSSLTILVLPL